MADSPLKAGKGNVKIAITSEGTAIGDKYRMVSLLVCRKINKIPYAKIVFIDGDMPNGDFPLSNKDIFKPGKSIKISAGYGQKTETVFEGIVVKHGIQISGSNASRLVLELKDKAVRMTAGRNNANFTDSKDSEVINTLIGNHKGLKADVGSTKTKHKQLVQYYATDWDFMLSRAEVNGLLVIVDDGKVTVKAPDTGSGAVLKVSYGLDLMYFKADADASGQLAASTGTAWSISGQKTSAKEGAAPKLNKQGNLTDADLTAVMGVKNFQLQSATPLESTDLQAWADSCLLRAGLSKITGTMEFQGNAKAKPGAVIELNRLGKRFNGKVFLSAVQHVFTEGNWITEADFGLKNDWFQDNKNIVSPPASGLLPGMDGLQTGIVEKPDGDPEGENRIQVKLPLLGKKAKAVWARMANFYGLNDYGTFFIPEKGTEVILGFFNNDPRYPVILGSLYSSKNKPPYKITADNFTKAITTKSKLKIVLDDEKKVTKIETPGGNKIVISDDEKSVLLSDQNNNKVTLSSDGISLKSPKDIKISAGSKIALDGTGGVSVSSGADIKLSGLNISQSANASFTAKGTASAEFSASGSTTVKGAVVMIN